jgi:copper(I)-binding protein
MIRPTVFLAGLVVTLTAVPVLWAADAANSIQVSDPSVRAVPSGQNQTGAYLTLHNTDKQNHALVKATSPMAQTTELHTVVDKGGMKMMRPVPMMDIPAGGATKLQPGGLHIMLIGLKQPLREGANVPITLGFEDGSSKEVLAPVRPIAMPGGMMDHGH